MSQDSSNLPKKVLLIDDDQEVLNRVKAWLESYKINVVTANHWQTALYQFNQNFFDACIIEQELDEMPGMILVQKWLRHENPQKRTTTLMLSLSQNRNKDDENLFREFTDISIVSKPYSQPILLSALSMAYDKKRKLNAISDVRIKFIDPLLRQEKFKEAIKFANEKLLGIGPKGKFMTAGIYEAAGELRPALKLYDELHQEDQLNMQYLNEIARVQMNLGDFESAQKAYEKADAVAPKNLQRIQEMAELYLKQSQPQKSVDKYKQLMSLNPDNPDMKYGFYERLVQCGFQDIAQEFCRQTSTPKELIRYYNNKGVMHSKASQFEKAIAEYTHARYLIPGNKDLYRIVYNLAIAHINLKSKDHLFEAKTLLEECLSLAPTFVKAKEKIAIVSKYLKDPGSIEIASENCEENSAA